jgi:hypothetical protein
LVLLHHGQLHIGWWGKLVWCQKWIHMLDRWHSWSSLEWVGCSSIHAHVVAVWSYTIRAPPLQCIIVQAVKCQLVKSTRLQTQSHNQPTHNLPSHTRHFYKKTSPCYIHVLNGPYSIAQRSILLLHCSLP